MLYEVIVVSKKRDTYVVEADNGIDAMNEGYDLFLRGSRHYPGEEEQECIVALDAFQRE